MLLEQLCCSQAMQPQVPGPRTGTPPRWHGLSFNKQWGQHSNQSIMWGCPYWIHWVHWVHRPDTNKLAQRRPAALGGAGFTVLTASEWAPRRPTACARARICVRVRMIYDSRILRCYVASCIAIAYKNVCAYIYRVASLSTHVNFTCLAAWRDLKECCL